MKTRTLSRRSRQQVRRSFFQQDKSHDRARRLRLEALESRSLLAITPLAITNHSFEDPLQPDGGLLDGTITGWTAPAGSGVFNPLAPGANYSVAVPDGQQVAFSNGPTVQTLTTNAVPGTVYRLNVAVGDRLDQPAPGYSVSLLQGASALGSISQANFPTVDGQFVETTLFATNLAGTGALAVQLGSAGVQTNFDNVRLVAMTLTIDGGGGNDAIRLFRDGGNIVVTVNGVRQYDAPVASTPFLAINGLGGDDTLTVDYVSGNPIPSGGVTFNGGAQTTADGDAIALVNGTVTTVTHNLDSSSSGSINIDGSVINYSGLEPIFDNLNAANRVFNFGAGNDQDVILRDDAVAGNGLNVIEAPANAESVTFANPTASLTVNLGTGDDIMEMRRLDSTWSAPTINISGEGDQDEVRIAATPAGATTNVNTGPGTPADRTILGAIVGSGGDDATNFAQFNTGVSTLDFIAGTVSVDDSGGGGQLFADDSGDVNADAVTFGAGSITGAAPAAINYVGGNLNVVQLALGTAGDTVNVTGTGSNGATTIFGNSGSDAFTIAGDALSANNQFLGGLGNDSFTLNIAANIGATGAFPIQSLRIDGNDPAASSQNRDRVTINDSAAGIRNLDYQYLSKASSDLDIQPGVAGGGLFGAANLDLQIRTTETVIFTSASANDVVSVTGTTSNDLLTVGLRNNNSSALVFMDGTPYLNTPPDTVAGSRPGMAGGGIGPDLLINGLAPATGIRLVGGGIPAGGGDRAIVYAASENSLVDAGNPTDIFGFGAGVLIPGFGALNAYDSIVVTDSSVTTTNNTFGALAPVQITTASFVQGTPPSAIQQAALIVNGGDEAAAQANGISDNIRAFISSNFNIQVNGNLPGLVLGPDGLPRGDQLIITGPGDINIFSDKATPPNVTVTFSGNVAPFGIRHSSIERLALDAGTPPASGAVNLIGDNNNPAVDQNDNFVVRGRDVDGNLLDAGYQEMTVSINGSAPILIDGVQRLNVYGDDRNPPPGTPSVGPNDIDTLDIRAYADNAANPPNNAPRGWGVDVFFDEGNPVGSDGNQADLLIYHTSAGLGGGGSVSENIVVQPSGPDNGEVRATNAVDGSVVVVIQYVANTDIIILDDDGALADTDSLTLNGTDPGGPQTSGQDTFVADFPSAGVLGDEKVVVTDSADGDILYRIRNFTGFSSIKLAGLAGADTISVTPQSGLTVNVDGGLPSAGAPGVPSDLLSVNVPSSATITQGADPTTGQVLTSGGAVVNFAAVEAVSLTSGDLGTLTVNATDDNDTIAAANLGANLVWVNDGPVIIVNGFSALTLNGRFGDDKFSISPVGFGVTTINVNGGDPTASDVVVVNGTAGLDTINFTPTSADAGTVQVSAGPIVNLATVEHLTINGLGGGDNLTINGTAADDTTVTNPTGGGSGTFRSSASPALDFVSYLALTVTGGAGGFDQIAINGTNGADIVTSDADTIFFAGAGNVTLGPGLDHLNLNTFDGNDNINLDLTVAPLKKVIDAGAGNDIVDLLGSVDADIFGGIGDDTITGSPAADLIFGGAGNDVLIGAGGADTIYGEEGNDRFGDPAVADPAANDGGNDIFFGGGGSDTFVWDPGDGSDVIEGGDGSSDVLVFNGGGGTDNFTLSSNGTRLFANRTQGAILLNTADVEFVNLNGLAGADTFTINDLYPTAVQVVHTDFGAVDGAVDAITIAGRDVSDNVNITPVAGVVEVSGLRYDVNVLNAFAADQDAFTLNSNNGNDNLVSPADNSLTGFFAVANFTLTGGLGDDFLAGYGTLNGDTPGNALHAGNDTLIGGSEGQRLVGGPGNDLIHGGDGADNIFGDDPALPLIGGEDTIVPGFDSDTDTIDGGFAFDTILVQGTSANDRIDARQDSISQIRYDVRGVNGGTGVIPSPGTETDQLAPGTVEELKIVAGSGDDIIRVTQSDTLIAPVDLTAFSLRFTVDGGAPGASDRLAVIDDGLGDTTIHRVGGIAGNGSYTIGALAPVVYTDVEFTSLTPIDPVSGGTGGDAPIPLGRLFVFKHDPYEQNNDRLNATFIGTGTTLDPVIDPGADGPFELPGDEDWYRIVPTANGDLDIRVFFRQQGPLANGRAGLPGNGDLDIALYDADGAPVAIAGIGTFGTNDTNDDERIRIPAVSGQTYYLRVKGAALANNSSPAINVYSLQVINTPAGVPFDLELDDVVGVATVVAPVLANQFNATGVAPFVLSTLPDFYDGKDIVFTSGPLNGLRGRIDNFTGAAFQFLAGTFPNFTTLVGFAGSRFQIESADTGRSQFDNITRDTTPTIFLRVPNVVNVNGVATLDDVPFNGSAPGAPPDEFIGIPFVPTALPQVVDATAPGFRVAIFVTEHGTSDLGPPNNVLAGYASPVDPVLRPGLFSFTFSPNTLLTSLPVFDGTSETTSFFLSARVEIIDPAQPQQAQGYGDYSQSLEIVVDTQPPPVFFGLPNVPGDGLLPGSDTGLNTNPETLNDLVTSDTTPGFFGQAEADAVIRLFIDAPEPGFPTGDGVFEPAIDFQIGFDVAEPFDGTNQYPNGHWQVDAVNFDLNAPPFSPTDGLRRIFVTAEDVAGNINPEAGQIIQELEIFIDTQGPQITDVDINFAGNDYALFDPKPSIDGPTPLVNSIVISVQDLPPRVQGFLFPAIKADIADNPGHYLVKGDYNGIIPILDIIVDAPVPPDPGPPPASVIATATIEIVFRDAGPDGVFNTFDDVGAPLPDDRFTLFVNDEGIVDFAGNILDGESNADEPHDQGSFPPILGVDGVPTGDGIPGGDFVARFTVDSRPEVAVWAGGSVWVDTNGNDQFDPNNLDFTNRDITYVLGLTSDDIFAGNFAPNVVDDPETEEIEGVADGFDKLAAYGRFNGTFRFLIDTDNDGVPDIEASQGPSGVNGLPVAGRFDDDPLDGDEVGVFTGSVWHFDIDHDFSVVDPGGSTTLAWPVAGLPIVGDFDGDGLDDLATFSNDTFSVDLSSIGSGGTALPGNPGINGVINRTFKFGFIGPGERPVAADMNQDNIEDLGLFVPARDGVPPTEGAEWYFLISGMVANNTPNQPGNNPAVGQLIGPTITGGNYPDPDDGPGDFLSEAEYGFVPGTYGRGRIVDDPLLAGPGNIVRFEPTPFGNDRFIQFGDQFALPLVGNFDPPVTSPGPDVDPVDPPVDPPPGNRSPLDVNDDGSISPIDALIVINYLNSGGSPQAPQALSGGPYMDVNADTFISPIDALMVINFLNNQAIGSEAEGEGESAADAFFSGMPSYDNAAEALLDLLASDAAGRRKRR